MNACGVVAKVKNQVSLEPFILPALKPHEVLLESLYTAISPGTELAWLQHQPSTPGIYPWYPGYSGCGRVLEKGSEVHSFTVGQLVACNMPHSSHVVVSESKCHPLAGEIDVLEASAFRLASIALQGVRKAQIQLGESVAVLGLGPIGLLAAQLARAAGATFVEGIDLLEWRRKLAQACQLDSVTASASQKDFEVVIEATGVPSVIATALQVAKQRGRLILLGSPRGLSDGINFYDVHRKGISILGAHELNRAQDDSLLSKTDFQDEETALKLLVSKRLNLKPLISDVVKPQEAAEAYARLAARAEELMLIVFDWQKKP